MIFEGYNKKKGDFIKIGKIYSKADLIGMKEEDGREQRTAKSR